MTSGIDTCSGVGQGKCRIGISKEALPIFEETDIFSVVQPLGYTPYCVLIDGAQFLSARHVLDLTKIVDELKIPVMAFGLKNDFRNELFEGSKSLLLYADKIEEMKTICWFCHKKAIMNLRYVNHVPVYEGEQVQIGGNETYYPVCRQHYVNPKMKSN